MDDTDLKRIEFTLRDDLGNLLQEPGFVEDCSALEAYNYEIRLPLTIRVTPNPDQPTC